MPAEENDLRQRGKGMDTGSPAGSSLLAETLPSSGTAQNGRDRAVEVLRRLQRAGVGIFAPMTDIAYLIYLREQYGKQTDVKESPSCSSPGLAGVQQEQERRFSQSPLRKTDDEERNLGFGLRGGLGSTEEKEEKLMRESAASEEARGDRCERDCGRGGLLRNEAEEAFIENSIYTPGMVGVMRLKDAAAVRGKLLAQVEKEIGGIALLADGSESEEEIDAVLDIQVGPAVLSGVCCLYRVSRVYVWM